MDGLEDVPDPQETGSDLNDLSDQEYAYPDDKKLGKFEDSRLGLMPSEVLSARQECTDPSAIGFSQNRDQIELTNTRDGIGKDRPRSPSQIKLSKSNKKSKGRKVDSADSDEENQQRRDKKKKKSSRRRDEDSPVESEPII